MNRLMTIAGVALLSAGLGTAADLKTYRDTYEKALEQIILSHGMELTELKHKYLKALNALLARVKKAGDLEKTMAVMKEVERAEKEHSMPEKPPAVGEIQDGQALLERSQDGRRSGFS